MIVGSRTKRHAYFDGEVFIGQEGGHHRRFPMNRRLEELWQADENGERVQREDVAVQHPGPRVVAGLPVVILDRMSEIGNWKLEIFILPSDRKWSVSVSVHFYILVSVEISVLAKYNRCHLMGSLWAKLFLITLTK